MLVLTILTLLTHSSSGDYAPGSPGAPWSQAELLVVRAKLWRIFADSKAPTIYNTIPRTGLAPPNLSNDLGFFPAKLLRLSFHDCLRYVDGSGGCDGCLNWEGVGVRFPPTEPIKYKFSYPDMKTTNNNGIEYAVAMMEELYTNPDFPAATPKLTKSLKSTGKSRADLWAYAAKVAVEFTVENNNFHCEKKPRNWNGSYVGKSNDCHRALDQEDCKVVLSREIKFVYGRKDCQTSYYIPYKAEKDEVHPNPEANGDSTIDFFKSEFDFTGRETVAIMGAHTLGRMYPSHSLFKYTWTSRAGNLFNNAYYKNFVNKQDYFYESQDKNTCLPIGDANGVIPDTKWVPTMNGFTKSGGPMHWIRMHFACPQCTYRAAKSDWMQQEFDECCVGKPEDLMCKPDNATRNEQDDIKGCEKYRFAFGLDEMTINAEMGLYYKFEEVNGIPTSCSGFSNFNMAAWTKPGNRMNTRRAYDHGCPLNMRQEPLNDDPLSTIIEKYAENQAVWVDDFIPAFEKMMRNGYSVTELTEAPSSWDNVQCRKQNGYTIQCS